MSDKNKIMLKWPLIDGILQQSDTTYLGPDNDKAMYIHEIYKRHDGQNTEVTKGIYSDGYRFIDMITGDKIFIQGYRPDGSINYTLLPEEHKKHREEQVPKGFDGMKIKRALNLLNPFTWPSRIAATLPKDAPEGTKFPAIVVDKKSQTLRYYDEDGEQQLSSIVSTGANKGDITAKAEYKTPEGHFTIGSKADNVKEGVFGDNLFMGLSGTSNSGFKVNGRGFGIHGDANRPFQLGSCDSHGCVRVENKNLDELYNLVQPGTNVYIRKKGGNIKLIPKGAKGWYASEMKTWSPEKMRQVLQQYGKAGLTSNTYAYLVNKVGEQKTKSPYIHEQASTETELPALQFQAASLGISNAYGITSEQELQRLIQSKQDVIDKEAAKQQVSRQQQAQYEDIWARKNYKAMTGKDWHAGIDLSNYTMSAIRKLQKEIGTTVDGKWGVESQQAYDIYQQKQNPESKSSTSASTQNTVKVTNPSQQTNYWELVKNDPEFAQWLYTSGGTGSGRRLANKVNVAGNYIAGMINPDGVTPFNIGQGLQRQAVGAALYNIQNGKSGVTDSAHYALGGLGTNKHSGTEFRQDNVDESGKQRSLWETVKVYADKAANAPYHYVYGESSDTRFESDGFHSEGDGYTFNNVWDGDKFVKELADGQGDSSTGFLTGMTNVVRGILSGGNPLAVMETQAANRGVNTQRNKKVKFVPQETLEDWAKEYYLAHNSQKSVVKSSFGGMLKHITGY